MSPVGERARRLAAELLVIAVVVAGAVIGVVYAVQSPSFDHPTRGGAAWRTFVDASTALSLVGTVAAWVVWLTWRRHAELDSQPDGPARLLAIGVAILPDDRREWGVAMSAELASVTDRAERWRFAKGGACAALASPTGGGRPAAGWVGGTIGARLRRGRLGRGRLARPARRPRSRVGRGNRPDGRPVAPFAVRFVDDLPSEFHAGRVTASLRPNRGPGPPRYGP